MAETTVTFDDGAAYERFMGRWSRAVGAIFLDWVAPEPGARWLDVGCGTGVFTELVVETCAPASVVAADLSTQQIEYARTRPIGRRAEFRVADAQALPFPDGAFDIVASALVINFIPDRPRGIAEMRRVARRGGTVAGYVWDFAAGLAPNAPLGRGMRRLGAEVPRVIGTDDSTLEGLTQLFERVGFEAIATRTIDVTLAFPDFDNFWRGQTPNFNPLTRAIMALPNADHARLIESVRASLPPASDGSISYSARANAINATVPG
jgi:ubiquinone/menaquinone biosynthesis C-methylase UbiE